MMDMAHHALAAIGILACALIARLVVGPWLAEAERERAWRNALAEATKRAGLGDHWWAIYDRLRDVDRRGRSADQVLSEELDLAAWRARRGQG
jgi:hypothetical protein